MPLPQQQQKIYIGYANTFLAACNRRFEGVKLSWEDTVCTMGSECESVTVSRQEWMTVPKKNGARKRWTMSTCHQKHPLLSLSLLHGHYSSPSLPPALTWFASFCQLLSLSLNSSKPIKAELISCTCTLSASTCARHLITSTSSVCRVRNQHTFEVCVRGYLLLLGVFFFVGKDSSDIAGHGVHTINAHTCILNWYLLAALLLSYRWKENYKEYKYFLRHWET